MTKNLYSLHIGWNCLQFKTLWVIGFTFLPGLLGAYYSDCNARAKRVCLQ